MAQSDNKVVVPNTVGATFRSNLNKGLEGLASTFSGDAAPTAAQVGIGDPLAIPEGFLWADTAGATTILKVFDGTDFVSVNSTANVGGTAVSGDVSGTVSNITVTDDQHSHTGLTISSLAAGDTTSGTFVETLLGTGTASDGKVLTAGSGNTASWADAAAGGASVAGAESGNFTFTPSGTTVSVTGCGGGGSASSQSGGGSAGWAIGGLVAVSSGTVHTVVVGAAGQDTTIRTGGVSGTIIATLGKGGNASGNTSGSMGSTTNVTGGRDGESGIGSVGNDNSDNPVYISLGGTMPWSVTRAYRSGTVPSLQNFSVNKRGGEGGSGNGAGTAGFLYVTF